VRLRAALLIPLVVGAGCGNDAGNTRPPEGSAAVRFSTSDGIELDGRLYGDPDGDVGVVLSHMFPADQTSWIEFAEILAQEGYRVLTYNFRGYCPGGEAGCSEGEKDFPEAWRAAVELLRSRGAGRVMLVGASVGGTASLVAAAQDPGAVQSVVSLSAPVEFGGLRADPATLSMVIAPKFFLAGLDDFTAAAAAEAFYAGSGPPKRVEILPTGDHGTDLLSGDQGQTVQRLVLEFLARYS
jgi:predicted alpha/beta-hydrolase family hydrolase